MAAGLAHAERSAQGGLPTDQVISFTVAEVTTAISNPNDSRSFTKWRPDERQGDVHRCLQRAAIGSDLIAVPLWTDVLLDHLAESAAGRGHKSQDAVTAAVP